MNPKKQRSYKKQIEVLVDFMATHNNLANGEFTGPLRAKRADSQWQILREILKEHGPDRSVDQWKQTWKDLKKKARSENAASSQVRQSTGNSISVAAVSNIGSKVLSIIGHECSIGIGPEESQIEQYSIDERLEHKNELLGVQNLLVTEQNTNFSLHEQNKLLWEQNNLLRDQNNLLREQNAHLFSRNKIKRANSARCTQEKFSRSA